MGILRGFRHTVTLIFGVLFFCFVMPFSAWAQGQGEVMAYLYEHKVKAGLVYNFLKYTRWPDFPEDEIKICLFGGDSFDGYLFPIAERTAQEQSIKVLEIDEVEQSRSCQLLYLHESKTSIWEDLRAFLSEVPVLTVSDIPYFTEQGGMVEMSTEGGRVQLYINERQARSSDLIIQRRLLRLAKKKRS